MVESFKGPERPAPEGTRRSLLGISLVVFLAIAAVQIVIAMVLVWRRDDDSPEISQAAVEFIRMKNIAISQLENGEDKPKRGGDLDQSTQLFAELAESLPGELLPIQNQAIAQSLFLKNSEDARTEPARSAMDRLLQMAPNSAEAAWLAAEILVALDATTIDGPDEVRAMQILRHAADENPRDLATRYAMYELGSLFLDGTPQQQMGYEALGEAYRIRPGNVRILLDWLVLQAQNQDRSILKTMEQARKTLAPLRDSLLARGNFNISETFEQAEVAVEMEQWPQTTGLMMRLRNVTISREEVKRDLAAAKPHPLDYVIFDFSDEFYVKFDPPRLDAGPAVPVQFQRFAGDMQFPKEFDDAVAIEVTDFDLNGQEDVIVLRDNEVVVVGRSKEGGWIVLTRHDVPSGGVGVLAADLDYDQVAHAPDDATANVDGEMSDPVARPGHEADVDLVVYGAFGAVVLRNEVDTEGTEEEAQATLSPAARRLVPVELSEAFQQLANIRLATLIDIDHDGDLDLVFETEEGLSIWLKAGEKEISFRNETRWSILPPDDLTITSMTVVDVDRDADLDIVIGTSDGKYAGYLDNLRHGRFQWQPLGEGFESLRSAESVAVLDTDGNASWDLAGAGQHGISVVQTSTPRGEIYKATAEIAVAGESATGLLVIDYDNDGFQDLFAYGGEIGFAGFRATGPQSFERIEGLVEGGLVEGELGVELLKAADLDRDGDLDLIVLKENGGIELLSNEGGNANHWIDLYAVGQSDNKGRAAHSGLGSLVELKSGNRYQAQVVKGLITHFGLGNVEQPDVLRIVWTNGVPQSVIEPKANQTLTEKMTLKGSCPYLYAWDGEKYVFVTDCLWAAPIGLQLAEGVMAPCRAWEYLKIDGELLKPKDHAYYELQLTEELWEAAYFDHVELIAVDHPADIEIYTNEKVGPAEIAQPKIHTVRNPRTPLAARDQMGRDVMPWVERRDGQYLRAFDRKIRQGLTEPHFLELDLGQLEDPQDIKLFLVGWIYPTDTSLNVAFSQNPELDGPRLPHILVPDEAGDWQETVAYMGFPGGKTKTICVDLSEVFLTDDYRLRIQTTAEIYWDAAFFTVDEPPAEVRQTTLELASADLHYRGFSRKIPYRNHAPEQYVYQDVSFDPAWPPMRGNFTRYGDVLDLLAQGDDRMVVMGAGDETTMRFKLPADPPPQGWKRDFVLHCVGWDKDADLNTVYGQSVEPLPFRKMQSYPYSEGEAYPDSAHHQQYLRTYQTRRQGSAPFWKQLVPPVEQ